MPTKVLGVRLSDESFEYWKTKGTSEARQVLEDFANGKLVSKPDALLNEPDKETEKLEPKDASYIESEYGSAPQCERRFFTATEPYCFIRIGVEPKKILCLNQCLTCDLVTRTHAMPKEKETESRREREPVTQYVRRDRRVGSNTYGEPLPNWGHGGGWQT
jgi:hypothetical protein